MDKRPADVHGPDPVETYNGTQPDDGEQNVSQSPDVDYSLGGQL
jgi:hypothetical protein